MALNTTALDVMGDALAAVAVNASLRSAGVDVSAANQPIAWTPSAGGVLSLSGTEAFTGPANQAVDAVGLYSADGLTFYGEVPIPNDGTNDLAFNAAGEYTLDEITLTGTAT